jgi:hypothetical protein
MKALHKIKTMIHHMDSPQEMTRTYESYYLIVKETKNFYTVEACDENGKSFGLEPFRKNKSYFSDWNIISL